MMQEKKRPVGIGQSSASSSTSVAKAFTAHAVISLTKPFDLSDFFRFHCYVFSLLHLQKVPENVAPY
jgi:hypothetical protein